MADKAELRKRIEDTMACTAFAEAGVPCPTEEQDLKEGQDADIPVEERINSECALFHESGPQCFL